MIWFYWGNQSMSFLRYMTLHSACSLNDEVTLITRREVLASRPSWSEHQDDECYKGEDYTPWLKELKLDTIYLEDLAPGIARMDAPDVHTSDLLNFWLLANKGGTVADMDIIFTKPVPPVEASAQIVEFAGKPKAGYRPVSFMQGKPDQQWENCYRSAIAGYNPSMYESCGADHLVHIKEFKRLPDVIVFPFLSNTAPYRLCFKGGRPLPEECIGIHWYAGWSQNWNSKFTHQTWQKIPCPVSTAIGATYHD